MEIQVNPIAPEQRRQPPTDETKLGFGKLYSDHMFTMKWTLDKGWTQAEIAGYRPLSMAPASLVLHYGQTVFEGLKAYRTESGKVNLFRPLENCRRLNRSAARLDLPQVEEELFMQALEALLKLDREWIPRSYGTSLYIRPAMVATEPYIGLKSAAEVLLFIITGPVGAYYPEGFNPVRITVCEEFTRAAPGGLGSAKTAANYAASLLAEKQAIKKGYTQVLWLDATHRKFVEEVGAMNIFFKIDGRVVTPSLESSTILSGITRDSVIKLLKNWGANVSEEKISINDVLDAQRNGRLQEIFGSGTAAVISPVGVLEYQGQEYTIADGKTGELAKSLFEELMGIQYGARPDPFGWVKTLD
ncbi:MAG: branched-chain amino acid aminotransferase [Deltaproteobacteria bacterium]|nr:branched-chain amino acid aminotransferase [Deltaproteobacteria bacterium]